ncbi:uncharacterized protein LOC131645230 [Vicia villosa]|uniref:uncharacterized protein LOC131645230 n=1 Tax=Vicia villosa TaxID=3911 RepID=UPI00273BC6AD|nr:uncharacterized protein LOC131645230 [Vicia villosa]
MFARGDDVSIQQMMDKFNEFSRSTGLTVNPTKCKIYCGGMKEEDKQTIEQITGFSRGQLPFRYLGIPLQSRKLSNNHCMVIAERIGDRMKHWSTKLLSFAGRVQLLKSVVFGFASYWMSCLPIPKMVTKKLEAMCRSFLWTGKGEITRKSPIAWDRVCGPKSNGGLDVINLEAWNKTCLTKLLWKLASKEDSLWVQWIHKYYIKSEDVMQVDIKDNGSWILRSIFKMRTEVAQLEQWKKLNEQGGFKMKKLYLDFLEKHPKVEWRGLMIKNYARPRAIFTMWLACHKRLATKTRLEKFGVQTDLKCVFCDCPETIQHLLFECRETKEIWEKVLSWLNMKHKAQRWDQELVWLTKVCKSRNWRSNIVKVAIAETVCEIWKKRNGHVFQQQYKDSNTAQKIIELIVNKIWIYPKYMKRIAQMIVE